MVLVVVESGEDTENSNASRLLTRKASDLTWQQPIFKPVDSHHLISYKHNNNNKGNEYVACLLAVLSTGVYLNAEIIPNWNIACFLLYKLTFALIQQKYTAVIDRQLSFESDLLETTISTLTLYFRLKLIAWISIPTEIYTRDEEGIQVSLISLTKQVCFL